MSTEKKWYAVYTKPRWEKKVASVFTKNNITNYCPIIRVVRQWSDRKKVVFEPLFRPFVFVQINKLEFLEVWKIDGVINFVTWLGKPAVIKDEEIETIQRFLKDHQNLQLKTTKVSLNDTVRIVKGPLMDQEGNVVQVKSNRIKISLPSMGYVLMVEVDTSDIEIVDKVE